MAEKCGAYMTIRSGEAIDKVIENGITTPHRDGLHVTTGAGRMLLGLLWYTAFTDKNADEILFPEPDSPITDEEFDIIRKTVKEVPAIRH